MTGFSCRKPTCYCYVDTNTFLHYQLFTEVNWREILNADKVVLVVCFSVISALDRQKMDPDGRIRERAKRVIAKLFEIGKADQPFEIKPGTEVLLLAREPEVDWRAEGLSPDVPDDRIIATILCERPAQENVILVTADLGLAVKGQARRIQICTLPENLLVSSTKTPLELENEKLRQRLAKLENRIPKLKLLLQSRGKAEAFARFILKKVAPLSKSEIDSRVGMLRAELDRRPISGPFQGNVFFGWNPTGVPESEIKRYNKEVDAYLIRMQSYFLERWAYKERFSRIRRLRLVLDNYGNEPAEDIDIFLHLPDGVNVFGEDDRPKPPKKPEKPSPPSSILDMFDTRSFLDRSAYMPRIFPEIRPGPSMDAPKGPYIKKTKSFEVKYSIPKLKHGLSLHLDPVFMEFPSLEEARSFHIDYSIFAGNVPEETKGQIHIITEVQES